MSNLNHAAEGVRMTNQEIFDRVIARLREQGGPALDEEGDCRYRAEVNGRVLMCAVGCLIADEHYSESLEGKSVDDDVEVREAVKASIGAVRTWALLNDLQRAHDFTWTNGDPSCFREVAEEYNLNTSALEGWA